MKAKAKAGSLAKDKAGVPAGAGEGVSSTAATGKRPLSQTPHCALSRAYHKARRLAAQTGKSDEEAKAEATAAGRAAVAALQS